MRAALAPQLRSPARTASPWSPNRDREARISARQYQRLRHADVSSGGQREHFELTTAMDLTSALELRLYEAEQRICALLRDVEYVEEFRQLFHEARERQAEGCLVVRPPSAPRPATTRTRPWTVPVAREEAASSMVRVEAVEARVAKLEALDLDGLKEVSTMKAAAEALDVRVASLEAAAADFDGHKEMERVLARESLATSTHLAELALQQDDMELQLESIRFTAPLCTQKRRWPKQATQAEEKAFAQASEVSEIAEQAQSLTRRQDAMESQFEEFGRALLGLLSDFQVHAALAEQHWGFQEASQRQASHTETPEREGVSAS
ncbi:unnamed protein product [Symbiodinium natans]|uniref:Uncharacterized protein n=1 Tax=Symbiodinium natans TaxID=878477 RepID=A0A812NPL3_9DINO|nr:unnamed protein product [Symbiodinium natans]